MSTGWIRPLTASVLVSLMIVATPLPLVADDSSSCPSREDWIPNAGDSLDKMAAYLEEFGSASISSPLLSLPDPNIFAFNLKAGADEYYDGARTESQLKLAGFTQSALQFGAGAEVTVDPLAAAAYAENLARYKEELQAYRQARAADSSDAAQKRSLEKRAAELEAQKLLDDLPSNATDAQKREAEAKRDRYLAEHLPTATTPAAPEYPTPPELWHPDSAMAAPSPDPALSALSSKQLQPYLALMDKLGGPPSKLANRAAISIAAGDTATEAIFRVLGQPAEAAKFKDKRVLFGVSMVSVNPGWRTSTKYAADVAMTIEFTYVSSTRERLKVLALDPNKPKDKDTLASCDASVAGESLGLDVLASCLATSVLDGRSVKFVIPEELRPPENYRGPSPLVAAVSPTSDSQVVDEAHSGRQQTAVALALGLALRQSGMSGQARSFLNYAKSQENDAASREAIAAVNSYSHSGGLIGFQVGPRQHADPSGGAGADLHRQSFPVLMVIGFDQRDLGIRFSGGGAADGHSERVTAYEPALKLCESARWNRLERRHWYDRRPKSELARTEQLLKWTNELRPIEATAQAKVSPPSQESRTAWDGLTDSIRRFARVPTVADLAAFDADALVKQIDDVQSCSSDIAAKGVTADDLNRLRTAITQSTESGNVVQELSKTFVPAVTERLRTVLKLSSSLTEGDVKAEIDNVPHDPNGTASLEAFSSALVVANRKLEAAKTQAVSTLNRSITYGTGAAEFDTAEDAFLTRARTSRYLGLGSCSRQALPTDLFSSPPSKTDEPSVEPITEVMKVVLGEPAAILVRGKNLSKSPRPSVKIGGAPVDGTTVLGDAILVVQIDGADARLKSLEGHIEALSVQFEGEPEAAKTVGMVQLAARKPESAACGFSIERDTAGRVIGVKVSTHETLLGSDGKPAPKDCPGEPSFKEALLEALRLTSDSSLSMSFGGEGYIKAGGNTGSASAPKK